MSVARVQSNTGYITMVTVYAWTNLGAIVAMDFGFNNGQSISVGSKVNAKTIRILSFPQGCHVFSLSSRVAGGITYTVGVRATKYNANGTIQEEKILSTLDLWPGNLAFTSSFGRSTARAGVGSVLSGIELIVTDPGYGSPISFDIQQSYLAAQSDPNLPVNGSWGPWSAWSACDANQKRTRTRTCTPPRNGGLDCVGSNTETDDCPQNGYFTEWSVWSSCDAKCGSAGQQKRTRTYIPAKFGGIEQTGPLEEIQTCSGLPCPVDGQFSEWSAWSVCNAQCGSSGQIKRTRQYFPAQNGGKELAGPLEEVISCDGPPCPVDGQFSAWSEWSSCDAQCDAEGKSRRTRTYTPAMFGGQDLTGPLEETQTCSGPPCPIDGQFSDWSDWSSCDAECNQIGQQKRNRTYTKPLYGGRDLTGSLEESTSCQGPPCPTLPLVDQGESTDNSTVTQQPGYVDQPNNSEQPNPEKQPTEIKIFVQENETILTILLFILILFGGYIIYRRTKAAQTSLVVPPNVIVQMSQT